MSKTRVYVSSTFEDLKDYRAKVNEGLRRAGYELVAMEDYPAFDRRPLAKCLADVASCDLYVGILAKRYGYIPDQGNPENLSITECEYHQATAYGLPRLVFQLDSEAPWLEQFDDRLQENGDRGVSIRRFRNHVGKEHGNRLFSSPDELARLVLEAASAWEKERHAEPTGKQPPSPLREPAFRWPTAWDFSAYMADKRRGFAGREWLFAHIQTWLADPNSRALLIRADYGVGKSALFAELVARNPNSAILAWHFCQHDTRETLRAGTFVRSLAGQLRDRLPGYREQVEAQQELQERLDKAVEDPGSAFEAAILNPLATLPPPPEPRLILIDALDEALEVDAEHARHAGTLVTLLANKARRLPAWVQLAVTSRNNPEVVNRLQQAFTLTQIDAEGQRNREDIYTFAIERASTGPIAVQIAAAGKSADWLAALLRDKAGGKFLYVARALRDLEGGRLTLAQAGALPPGMDGFYRDAFERRFDKAGRDFEAYRTLLGLLCVLREPVTAESLAELLGCQPGHIKQAHTLLPDFIVKRQRGYTFEHFSIAEWLSREDEEGFARAGPYAVEVGEAEARIHDRAIARIAEGSTHHSDYLVRHLVHHLPDRAERQKAFTTLMQDYRWLLERLRLAGADALIADCQHLGDSDFGRLLAACLRNATHLLWRDPGWLVTQLLGRLSDRNNVPGIAKLCASVRSEVEREVNTGEREAALLLSTASLGLRSALLQVLEGHAQTVTALAALPDGRLASGSEDCMIRLWDLTRTGSEPQVLEGHGSYVNALAVLRDGRLASGSDDSTIRLWDLTSRTGTQVLEGQGGTVKALAVLSDGRLASGSADGTICLWNLDEQNEAQILQGRGNWVTALARLPNGRLASGYRDGTVIVWELERGAAPKVLGGHGDTVSTLVALPDGRIASGSHDETICLWDLSGGEEPRILDGHHGWVTALAVLPDGRLASAGSDRTIRLWSLKGGAEPQVLEKGNEWLRALAVLPDGYLASGGDDHIVRLWDPEGEPSTKVLASHPFPVWALEVLPDSRLASAHADGAIILRDVKGQAEPQVLGTHGTGVYALAVTSDGKLASGAYEGTIRLWDVTGLDAAELLEAKGGSVMALAVLPDKRLVSGCANGTIYLWDPAGRAEVLVLTGNGNRLEALAVLPDGRLAVGGRNIRLLSLRGDTEVELLKASRYFVRALALLPDGRLAAGTDRGTIRIWDLMERTEVGVLETDGRSVNALAVLRDGRLVAAAGQRVLVWRRPLDRVAAAFEAEVDVRCLAILQSGQIAAGDENGCVHVLDLIEIPK